VQASFAAVPSAHGLEFPARDFFSHFDPVVSLLQSVALKFACTRAGAARSSSTPQRGGPNEFGLAAGL
jgi:hypothetical protein